jgi:nucleotide-binding universal stress UspA family protein
MLHLRRHPVRGASWYAANRETSVITDAATIRQDHDELEAPRAPHVLIAVDETPAGRRTLVSGLADAAAHGADVTVLHVTPPRRWRTARFGPVRAVPMRVRDPLASPVLRDARRLAFGHGICPRLELIAADDAGRAIVDVAHRLRAGTIVVGASRPEGLAAPLGVCQGVLRRAPVPVVVVPAG